MKIGMISKYLPEEDGIAIYAAELCRELQNAGIEIVKIGDKESTGANYTVDFKSWLLKWQLEKIIKKEKFDVLHIQYIAAHFGKWTLNLNLLLALGALGKQVPIVVTLHEVHATAETTREKILGFLQKQITKKAAAVITHTRQQKEFLQLRHGKKESYAVLMGTELKPMHKLTDKKLLFFGMLGHGKGAEHLISAMNELPDYKLTVAGKAVSSEYEKILRETAAQNKFGNVKLDIRWVPEEAKQKYMEEADIMVFPYVWAPYQSAAIHDSFSYGMPVVVTDAGAIGEVVKEFICGRVVEQRSPKALAAGIKAVHSNYETYQHGVAKYRQEASWEKTAQKHGEIYNQTLQEHYDKHGMPEHKKADEELAEAAKDEAEIFKD